MTQKAALITGIGGQDGSYLAELLLEKGYRVHGLMRRSSTTGTSRIDHLKGRLSLHDGDLMDAGSIARALDAAQPDEVYNLGAQTFVPASFSMPIYTGDATGLGTTRLLEAIRQQGRTVRFYQASTSEMFGSSPPPQSEKTKFHPRSPYGVAKLYAHYMTVNYREAYKLFACNGILFNHECVVAETPVIVRKRGVIDILPIEEVVPHRQDPRGCKKYTSEPSGLEVWDRDGWVTATTLTATWADGSQPVRRIAARGAVFTATHEHVAFVGDDKEVRVGDIDEGNRLALCKSSPSTSNIVEMTDGEAWLLGVLAGDGYISENGQHVRVTTNDEQVLSQIEHQWRALTCGTSRRGKGTSGFKPGSEVNVTDMQGPPSAKAGNDGNVSRYGRWLRAQLYTERGMKRVPQRVLNATRDVQISFLRGYNLVDGLIHGGHGTYEFKCWKTDSQCLAAGLWWMASNVLDQRKIICLEEDPEPGRGPYYIINLNVPDGDRTGNKGMHLRRPIDEVVKATDIKYEGWLFDVATESGTFHAGIGEGWIHNSPRRGETFVSRKITQAAVRIKLGIDKELRLGNLEAKRDWGHAKDYVHAMWLMLQADEPDDYVVATGHTHTIRDFLDVAFDWLDLDWQKYVKIDQELFRPAEVHALCGDATKASEKLGWRPEISFEQLVRQMVDADWRSYVPEGERKQQQAG